MHVFLELPDHLGSSAIVVDQGTSELVERGTYTAFGKEESDYRPDRWGDFREEKRFTGKEDDIEVGLHYIGARYYSAALGAVGASPDPLALHSPGAEDDNVYAYGHGRVFMGTDSDGRLFGIDDLIVIGDGLLNGAAIGAGVNAVVQGVAIGEGRQAQFSWESFWMATAAGAAAGASGGARGRRDRGNGGGRRRRPRALRVEGPCRQRDHLRLFVYGWREDGAGADAGAERASTAPDSPPTR